MKQFYRITRNSESKPSRLIASIGLAFIVMLFVNGFIGGMGGFPAFIAFFIMFFWLRTLIGDGNQIIHQLAMTSRREVSYLLFTYSAGYLLLWVILRLGHLISRVTGWGNINGDSLSAYVQKLLAASMPEKWAYLIAGIWMFAFVTSLFPLIVIRKRINWIVYAMSDGSVFALLCIGIGKVCDVFFCSEKTKRASCLIDHLLLCDMNGIQEFVFLAAVTVLMLLVFAFVWCYACMCYGPRRGRMDEKAIAEIKKQIAESSRTENHRKHGFVITGICLAIVAVAVVIILFTPEETTGEYHKVAEFLTNDVMLGPIRYQGELYLPVNEVSDLDETGIARGYLAERGRDCNTRFYQLAVANLLYTDSGGQNTRLKMQGASQGVYAPMEEVERQKAWETDEVFLLWDEDWVSESAYMHEPTGYTACNKDFIEGLEMQFSNANYDISDFDDYDAYFTINSYSDMDSALEDAVTPGHWVGCILVKNNKFYYDSYKNQITGISLQQLLDILGGY